MIKVPTLRGKLFLLAGALLTVSALGQSLSGMVVEPASPAAGGLVKATLNFEVRSGTNCGMRLHWGDGRADDFKINQRKDVPWIASHSYARAGSYVIMAEPKTQGFVPRCGGDNQRFTLVVGAGATAAVVPGVAPTPAPSGTVPRAIVTAPGAPAGPCPDGWRMGANGIDARTQAFTCIAAPNTRLPARRLNCPGALGYFENARKGELGCQP